MADEAADIVVSAQKGGTYGHITETSTGTSPETEPSVKQIPLTHAETTISGEKKIDGQGATNTYTGVVKDGGDVTLNRTHTAQVAVAPDAKAAITMNGTTGNDFFQVYDQDREQKTGKANVTINSGGGDDTVAITNLPPDQVFVTGVAGNPHQVTVKAGPNEYTLNDITYLKGRPDDSPQPAWDQSKHHGAPLPENTHGADLKDATFPNGPLADGKTATLAQLLNQYDLGAVKEMQQYNQKYGIQGPQPTNHDSGQLAVPAGGQRTERAGPGIP